MLKVHSTQADLTLPNSPKPFVPTRTFSLTQPEIAHTALQTITQAVIAIDGSGTVQYCNPSAATLLTFTPITEKPENVLGQAIQQVLSLFDQQTQQPLSDFFEQVDHADRGFELRDRAIVRTVDQVEVAIDLAVTPIYDAKHNRIGAVILIQDVTQARAAKQALSWQAQHDPLTNLVNRREFETQLERIIQTAQDQATTHTLCYIDLDQFKIVNDTCGHNAGDELLRRLAQIFRHEVRRSDVLSRIGGDEFGILFYDCGLHQAQQIVERIHQQISQFRFVWAEQSFNVSASFGLVQIDADNEGLTAVLRAADAACYAAKEAGRNRIHLYYSDDGELARQRGERLWISQIHQAIEEERFQLYAQDIVPIAPERDFIDNNHADELRFERHVEILLRMVDRDGKIIPPGCFIPAAERYSLMTTLDKVVIQTFFESYATACLSHSGRPLDSCLYAINLSARSLNDAEFIHFVKAQFQQYRLPPHIICFEITETAAISNVEQASQFIQELKQMGCHFALDDFGSGMNCFAYLKQLKIDYLKIDGSFIKNIDREKIDQELVTCMHRIAYALGVKTVAEWVENDAILQTLKQLGIDYAQGYGIHQPEPLNFTLLS